MYFQEFTLPNDAPDDAVQNDGVENDLFLGGPMIPQAPLHARVHAPHKRSSGYEFDFLQRLEMDAI